MAKNDGKIAELEQELKELSQQADRVVVDFTKKMDVLDKKHGDFLRKIREEEDQKKIKKIIDKIK